MHQKNATFWVWMNSENSRSFRGAGIVLGHQNRDQLNWVPSGCGPAPANHEFWTCGLSSAWNRVAWQGWGENKLTSSTRQRWCFYFFGGSEMHWDAPCMITGIWFLFLVGPRELACKLNTTHPLQSSGWPPTPSYIQNTPKRDHVTLRDHPSRIGVCHRFHWISYSRSWDPPIFVSPLMLWLHHDCPFVCIKDWGSYYPENTQEKLVTHHLCSNASGKHVLRRFLYGYIYHFPEPGSPFRSKTGVDIVCRM